MAGWMVGMSSLHAFEDVVESEILSINIWLSQELIFCPIICQLDVILSLLVNSMIWNLHHLAKNLAKFGTWIHEMNMKKS